MGGDRDEVILDEWERERLAGIEAGLRSADPRLARQLTRARGVGSVAMVAAALIVLGAAAAVATFTRWLWLATTGLAVMAIGMGLALNPTVAWSGRYRPRLRPAPRA